MGDAPSANWGFSALAESVIFRLGGEDRRTEPWVEDAGEGVREGSVGNLGGRSRA